MHFSSFIFVLPKSKNLWQKENTVKKEAERDKVQSELQEGSVRKQRHPSTWRTVPSSAWTSKIHSSEIQTEDERNQSKSCQIYKWKQSNLSEAENRRK